MGPVMPPNFVVSCLVMMKFGAVIPGVPKKRPAFDLM